MKKSKAFDFATAKPNQHSKNEFEWCIGCCHLRKDTIKIMCGSYGKWKPQFICENCAKSLVKRFREFNKQGKGEKV